MQRKREQRARQVTEKSHEKRDMRDQRREREREHPQRPLPGWRIPKCLDSEKGLSLIETYAALQKRKERHDPVSFQATLSHLADFQLGRRLACFRSGSNQVGFKPDYHVDWESYAPLATEQPKPTDENENRVLIRRQRNDYGTEFSR